MATEATIEKHVIWAYEKLGYEVGRVYRKTQWGSFDLFKAFDYVCVAEGEPVIFLQATALSKVSARRNKVDEWLAKYGSIQALVHVVGWDDERRVLRRWAYDFKYRAWEEISMIARPVARKGATSPA